MAPNILHLPNGQTITVTSVYGGLYFKNNDLSTHQQSQMPPGWTIVLHKEDDDDGTPKDIPMLDGNRDDEDNIYKQTANSHIHLYRKPTLHNDALYISSISNPSSNDFKPAVSPTRSIALMLWTTLWWYFHQVRQVLLNFSMTTFADMTRSQRPHHKSQMTLLPEPLTLVNQKANGVFVSKRRAY